MNPLQWARISIREKGVVQTIKIAGNVALDLSFDWRYGTDTMGWVAEDGLAPGSENEVHSAPYRATKARPFLQLLKELELPHESTFVDIGSGKGRVLLIASKYGFRHVRGIEFSGHLCELARKNVEIFAKRNRLNLSIEVVETDATSYSFAVDERVFFMYNPFDDVILRKVVDNLKHSVRTNPRSIWVIYNTPIYQNIFHRSELIKSESFYEIGGNHFMVYTN